MEGPRGAARFAVRRDKREPGCRVLPGGPCLPTALAASGSAQESGPGPGPGRSPAVRRPRAASWISPPGPPPLPAALSWGCPRAPGLRLLPGRAIRIRIRRGRPVPESPDPGGSAAGYVPWGPRELCLAAGRGGAVQGAGRPSGCAGSDRRVLPRSPRGAAPPAVRTPPPGRPRLSAACISLPRLAAPPLSLRDGDCGSGPARVPLLRRRPGQGHGRGAHGLGPPEPRGPEKWPHQGAGRALPARPRARPVREGSGRRPAGAAASPRGAGLGSRRG